ncbi:MAG: ATP-grasp domain-containing protein [Gemmatimonadaceae bacterium]
MLTTSESRAAPPAFAAASHEGTLLVVEVEGATEVAATAARFGWAPQFVQTDAYRAWLPMPERAWEHPVHSLGHATFLDLAELAHAVHARAVLPVSLLEPECARDALLRDYLERVEPRVRVVANRPSAVELTYDKWLTKRVLEDAEFPVVPGTAVGNPRQLREAAETHGFPLVCKPRRAYTGRGMRILTDGAALDDFARRHTVTDLVVEPFLAGAELSVEVVRARGGCVVQPVVYKGETRLDPVEHPAYRPRVAPWRGGSLDAAHVSRLAVAIATELRLEGAIECEFIHAGGEAYLLEVNARISGVSRLASAASGVSSFAALTCLAIGRPPGDAAPADAVTRHPRRMALQLPVVQPVTVPEIRAALAAGWMTYAKPITWMPQLPLRGSVVLQARDDDELTDRVATLAPLTSAAYLAAAAAAVSHATHGPRVPVASPCAAYAAASPTMVSLA